jgi:hypothetical protein
MPISTGFESLFGLAEPYWACYYTPGGMTGRVSAESAGTTGFTFEQASSASAASQAATDQLGESITKVTGPYESLVAAQLAVTGQTISPEGTSPQTGTPYVQGPASTTPATPSSPAGQNAQDYKNATTGSFPNPLAGLADIGNFFYKLGEGQTWIRVAEVVVGILVIAVALNKISGDPAGKIASVAAKVPV